jgi:predicted secreted protein
MGLVQGKDVVLNMQYGADWLPVGCARSCSFQITNELIETSITGSGSFRTYIIGASTFSGSIEGLVFLGPKDNYDRIDMGKIYELLGGPINMRFYEKDEENELFLQKECIIFMESLSETASFDNMPTFSINFKGSGAPTITYDAI